MMMTMIQFIQKECDRQAREIFQYFRENRDFDHKVINFNHLCTDVLLCKVCSWSRCL